MLLCITHSILFIIIFKRFIYLREKEREREIFHALVDSEWLQWLELDQPEARDKRLFLGRL